MTLKTFYHVISTVIWVDANKMDKKTIAYIFINNYFLCYNLIVTN